MVHVAIDLGAESGRLIVGDLRGFEVIRRFPTKSIRIRGYLFWDLAGIFAEILSGLAEAFGRFGRRIESVGIDTWGVDYGLLDADGLLLGAPFHYRDAKNAGVMESLRAELGDARIYGATGIQFLPFNTIYQLTEELRNRPGRLAAADAMLTIPDLLNYWLSGVKASEFSNATTTGLYNPQTRDWAWDLIYALGLPRRLFQPIVQPGSILGHLDSAVAGQVGAPWGVKVIAPACHDTGSAVASVPGSGENFAYLSSGTWSLIGVELDQPLMTEAAMRANFTNEGAADGRIRFLKNIAGLWILQECRKDWAVEDGGLADYGDLAYEAGEGFWGGEVIDVGDARFLGPSREGDGMVDRICGYCREQGQRPPRGRGETVRLILESLAAAYAKELKVVGGLTGRDIDCLFVVGGGSRNDFLNQLTADRAGIRVCAGPAEATALGNLLLQSLALGRISSLEEGRGQIRANFSVKVFEPCG